MLLLVLVLGFPLGTVFAEEFEDEHENEDEHDEEDENEHEEDEVYPLRVKKVLQCYNPHEHWSQCMF